MAVRFKKRKTIIVGVLILLVLASVIALAVSPINEKNRLFENRVTKLLFRHSSISLGKISDLLFLPYFFRSTGLETYNLYVSLDNLLQINNALPEDRGFVVLSEDNKLFVNGYFSSGEYSSRIDVRYRGELQSHWIDNKKSYRIDFPSENLFRGMRSLNVLVPDHRQDLIEPLNAYRARKLGILAPDYYFVRVALNGIDSGVYLAFEQWSQEWLEKKPLSAESAALWWANVESNLDPREILETHSLPSWGGWRDEEPAHARLETLIDVLHTPSDEEFKKVLPAILDLNAFYSWDIVAVLTRGYHQMTGNNLILFYNATTGKFEPVINHIERGGEEDLHVFNEVGLLSRRILSIPEFRKERDARLFAYVDDEKNLQDDLAYYDALAAQMRPEYLSDFVKVRSNLTFLGDIAEDRQSIIDNIRATREAVTNNVYEPPRDLIHTGGNAPNLAVKYPDLVASVRPPTSVPFKYGMYTSNGALHFLPGEYIINQTLIIPRGTKLFIYPGTTLYFGEDASLISYSPVIANGTQISPITLKALDPRKPWGVFAVVDTQKAKSVFRYVRAERGSDATINGVPFTGMLALHRADGTIEYSEFSYAQGDDAVNVKGGAVVVSASSFHDNTSDGIDIDFPSKETTVVGNNFRKNGGDAIDLSWSDIHISKNEIVGCGDKGISVGESSRPTITNNEITGCVIGVAVKDSSHAILENDVITGNKTGLSLYQKKKWFGGGTAQLTGVVIQDNEENIVKDEMSSFEIQSP